MHSSDLLSKAPNASDITNRINCFMRSPAYIVSIMLLTALSNLFSLELVVYSVYALLIAYSCILGADLLPLMPIFVFAYVSPSRVNNPGRNTASVFSFENGGLYIICLGVIMAACVIYRVVKDRKIIFGQKRQLTVGILILMLSYLTGGIGSSMKMELHLKSALFGFIQGCSIALPYFLFCGGVDWKNVKKTYFFQTAVCVGILLLMELGWIYLTGNVINKDGIIIRSKLYSGWGVCNNIGFMLVMMVPYVFYLATKSNRGWLYCILGSTFMVGIIFSCSRNANLTGLGIFLISIGYMLYRCPDRKKNAITLIVYWLVVLAVYLIWKEEIYQLFEGTIKKGLSAGGRDTIFEEGVELFTMEPLLGNSFYSPGYLPWDFSTSKSFSSFFPPRWHNTFVQLMACCGIFGVAAYLYHRFQTVMLFLRNRNDKKIFIAISILALLVSSMMDCHFFNVGPVLFYSMALAFAENCELCN